MPAMQYIFISKLYFLSRIVKILYGNLNQIYNSLDIYNFVVSTYY